MADVSIANLPAFLGANPDPGDLLAFVRVSDTTESPLGTTRRLSVSQALANQTVGGGLTVNGPITAATLIVGPDPGGTDTVRVNSGSNNSALRLSSDAAAVGPVFRMVRTHATARMWHMRLATDGSFQFVDETGGVLAAYFLPTTGAFVIGADPGGIGLLRVGGHINLSGNVNLAAGSAIFIGPNGVVTSNVTSTIIRSPAGSDCLVAQNAQNYYFNDTHSFFNLAQTVQYATFNATAITFLKPLAAGVVIGSPDPGSAEMLRVVGSARFGSYVAISPIGSAAQVSLDLTLAGTSVLINLANSGTYNMVGWNYGFLYIMDGTNGGLCMMVCQGGLAPIIVGTTNGEYTTVSGTSGKVNIYWNSGAGCYTLQNLMASTINFRVMVVKFS